MRDFRDAKAMAQTVRAALAAKGLKISVGESLELIAKALGASDWNTLSAAIKAADVEPEPSQVGRVSFCAALEATLHRAVGLARARKHEYATLEHLLLALIDDPDAAEVMRACDVDLGDLRKDLIAHVDDELGSRAADDHELAKSAAAFGEHELVTAPTAAFQRVIQRAVVHVQSAGRHEVTGANVLVGIFTERETYAADLLWRHKMERFDAVNFIAHGIRKNGGRAV